MALVTTAPRTIGYFGPAGTFTEQALLTQVDLATLARTPYRTVPDDLNVIGISTGVRADQPNYPPSQWIEDMEWSWAALPDSDKNEAAYAYGVTGFPTFVVIGGDGLVKYRGSGEKSLEEVDAVVKKALALT